MVTHCISTYNNLPYLRLVLKSIAQNAFYKRTIVYAENCTDGTDEWLAEYCNSNSDATFFVEKNEVSQGIGGGMNKCAERVETEYLNFLHSDMWVTKDFDKPLLAIVSEAQKTLTCSWRIEPDIFGGSDRLGTTIAPKEEFGYLHSNFDSVHFDEWAQQFISSNLIRFRKTEGVSFMIRKSDWDFIGGNDPLFAPASFEDHDLFARMTIEGFDFIETSESLVFHFGARGSIFRGDDLTVRHPRQIKAERDNIEKWVGKWGNLPVFDKNGFIVVTEQMKGRYEINRR